MNLVCSQNIRLILRSELLTNGWIILLYSGDGRHILKSNKSFSRSGVPISGISTLEKEVSGFPSRAKSARRRIESLSPRLTLLSEFDDGRSGRETPMSSADSVRVETEEWRRWWELRLFVIEGGRLVVPGKVKVVRVLSEVETDGWFKLPAEKDEVIDRLREWQRECERECERLWFAFEETPEVEVSNVIPVIPKDSNCRVTSEQTLVIVDKTTKKAHTLLLDPCEALSMLSESVCRKNTKWYTLGNGRKRKKRAGSRRGNAVEAGRRRIWAMDWWRRQNS